MKANYSKLYKETLERIGNYGKVNPEFMGALFKLQQIGSKPGALSTKDKALMALGISIYAKCDGCISMHANDALENSATTDEIIETIGTAITMGGGPAVVYGTKAFEVFKEFEREKQKGKQKGKQKVKQKVEEELKQEELIIDN